MFYFQSRRYAGYLKIPLGASTQERYMIILWIRKKNAEAPKDSEKNEEESFHKHDEIMKRFRYAHPDLNVVSSRDILTTEGNLLAPLEQVTLTDHVQN
jgi:hypothetical protein